MDPHPLDEGARPRSGKSSPHLHGSILEGKSISSNHKKELKRKFMILENQGPRQGPTKGFNMLHSNESKLVPRNLDLGPPYKMANIK